VDWNDDGKKDILTGENSGNIRIYLNTGTDAAPAFSGYTLLQVAGSTFDSGYYSWIHVTDWNNDTLPDVLCGESYGTIYLLLNEGKPGAPLFNSTRKLMSGSATLDVGSRSSPTVVDWNGDGKKDLLSGNSSGQIYYFENTGTDSDPVFGGFTPLYVGGSLLDVGYDAHPDVADWNNDGVMDIITGEFYGNVLYFEAMGPMSADATLISRSGGQVNLHLNAGAANAGRNYVVLGSISGTSPGFALPGGLATMPLNRDVFSKYIQTNISAPYFVNFTGSLDASGEAKAMFDTLGPIPPVFPTGKIGHFAYALAGPWNYTSNAVAIEIVP
jgi:hypothetical protein